MLYVYTVGCKADGAAGAKRTDELLFYAYGDPCRHLLAGIYYSMRLSFEESVGHHQALIRLQIVTVPHPSTKDNHAS
jgi:hypothetical protein